MVGKGERGRGRVLPGTPELGWFFAFFAVADEFEHAKRPVGCVWLVGRTVVYGGGIVCTARCLVCGDANTGEDVEFEMGFMLCMNKSA